MKLTDDSMAQMLQNTHDYLQTLPRGEAGALWLEFLHRLISMAGVSHEPNLVIHAAMRGTDLEASVVDWLGG